MRVIIDRFEGDYAICETEDGNMINIKKGKIPKDAKEGHVLSVAGDRAVIDYAETKKHGIEIKKMTEDLWK